MCCLRNSIQLFDGECGLLRASKRKIRAERKWSVSKIRELRCYCCCHCIGTNFFIFHKFKRKTHSYLLSFYFYYNLDFVCVYFQPTTEWQCTTSMSGHRYGIPATKWNKWTVTVLCICKVLRQPIRWSVRSACDCCSTTHISPSSWTEQREPKTATTNRWK